MGTRERRQREVAEREQRFLDAARELIRQDGLLNLQMTKVADRCEYAVGTLYQHFASKEDLLLGLVIDNTHHRLEAFERLASWKACTRDRMFGVAVADMWLVRHLPELFRLEQYVFTEVVWGAASPERRQEALDAGEPIGRIVEAIVAEAVRVGDVEARGLRGVELSVAPWALSEGTHMLAHAEGLVEKYEIRDPYRLMLRHQQSLLNGLGWKPLFDAADDQALDRKIETLCSEVFHGLHCDKSK
ncbi:MAG TPA: helix-turn-helix domain-containing protein [Solimonas sp.]|nr:helix-turn-helix domain-containing protein [Solimonas sp.]